MSAAPQPEFERLLLAQQLRLHARVLPLSLGITLSLAITIAYLLRASAPLGLLQGWLCLVVASGVLRLALNLGSAANATASLAELQHARWRYRAALLLQGLAWALGGCLAFVLTEPWQIDLLLLAMMGMACGALLTTSFDPKVALAYAVLALAPVLAYVLIGGQDDLPRSLPIVALLLPTTAGALWRNQRALHDAVQARLAEQQRNDELRRAAELLDRTGAVAGVGGFEIDLPDGCVRLSPQALRVLGLATGDKLSMEQAFALLDDETRLRMRTAVDQALRDGQPFSLEAELHTSAGRLVIVHVTGQARRDASGHITGVDGALQDVTRLHVTDRALADKHQLLEHLLRTTRQGFWFVDTQGRTTDLNPAMATLLGRARDEVLGRPAIEFFTGEDLAVLNAELAARREGRDGSFELGITRPDGSRRRCLVNASPLYDARGALTGSVSLWTDITRRHQAEEALRVSDVVINSSAEMFSVLDGQERYHMVNDAWCRNNGLTRHQALGQDWQQVLPAVITAPWREALHQCLDTQQPVQLKVVLQAPGQAARHLHTDFYPVLDGNRRGQRLAALATRDTTQEVAQREALVAAAEYLRGTLDSTGDGIFATDADNLDEPVRFANAQLVSLFGLPRHDRAGLTVRQILDRVRELVADPDAMQRQADAIVAAGRPHHDRLQLADGRVLERRFASLPVNGRQLRVWSVRDITSETRAVAAREATLAEQRALLDNFPGYIAVINDTEHYLHINERLARLLQEPQARIAGRPMAEVLGESRARKLRQVVEQALRTGQAVADSQYLNPDSGEPVDLEVSYVAPPPGADGQRCIYAFGVDITERKRAQAALIDALAEAERANQAKSQFLSSMSHELRTPLNAVLGFGQLLAQQPLEAGQQQQVGEILRGGRHLLDLINDLLDLGRIESGELEVVCSPVDALAAIDECLGLVRPLAFEHGVVLRQRCPGAPLPAAWADAKRLRQVLLNLLSNAIKYNQSGGLVVVEAEQQDGLLTLRVRDSGPGLTADEQQRLFRPFERLGAARRSVDGTGIGLALSRYLVEAMGGHIGVHSAPGQGSTFWFTLRLASAGPAPAPAPVRAANPGQEPALEPAPGTMPGHTAAPRRRALYIEDNPVNLMLMAAMLEDELDLATEADPIKGLDQALALRPDLILLDIQLPGMDGYEVLRRLRADPRTQATPVVAVSANAMQSDVAAGQAAGFDAYLTKPVDLDELLTTVRRLASPTSDNP